MKKVFILFFLSVHLNLFAQGSGNCIQFNGVNDYVDFGVISLDTNNFSFEVWTYLFQNSPSQPVGILGNWVPGGTTPYFYAIYNYPGANQISLAFHKGDNINQYATWNMSPNNTWIHIAGVFDRDGLMQLYINGELKATKDISASHAIAINSAANRFQVGYAGTAPLAGFPWWGYLDEVRLWNKVLTVSEIRLRMCHKLVGTEPGLIGYWRFDESSGLIATDSSPFLRNGSLY